MMKSDSFTVQQVSYNGVPVWIFPRVQTPALMKIIHDHIDATDLLIQFREGRTDRSWIVQCLNIILSGGNIPQFVHVYPYEHTTSVCVHILGKQKK